MTNSAVILVLLPWTVTGKISSHYTDTRIRLVEAGDPIVTSALEELGPGWTLAPDTGCHDNEGCQNISKLDCHKNPKDLLSQCRKACTKHFENDPQDFENVGGIGDTFTDPFGFMVNICSEADGFDETQRRTFVQFNVNVDDTVGYIPRFTTRGVEKVRMPESLFRHFQDKLERNAGPDNWIPETETAAGVINNQIIAENGTEGSKKVVKIPRSKMLYLDMEDIELTFKTLGPLAEEWAGVKLRPSSIYGIRRYVNNSALISHIDKVNTHVISLILNLGQDVEEDWPLFVRPHTGEDEAVLLRPGDMLWYESASVIHGRQWPLRGNSYDNLFVHFKPRGRTWYQ